MKTPILALLLFVPLFLQAQSDEELILNIETKRSAAIAAHDHDYLASLYDEQFHGVTATGKVLDKKALLEVLQTNNPHVTFSNEDMKTSFHGTTAVVTGILVSKSKSGNVLGQTRFIHVYVKRNNDWKILEGQATVIH